MKKINKNLFVFIIVFLIVGTGYLSRDYVGTMINSAKTFVTDTKVKGPMEVFSNFTSSVDNNSVEYLSNHSKFMDINSLYNNIINTRMVKKDDETVIKMDNGYLAGEVKNIPSSSLKQYAKSIKELQNKTNTPVVYVMAPEKGYNGGTPSNAQNNIKSNCDRFINELKRNSLDYLDLRDAMNKQKISEKKAFFNTDHHWKPSTGLWVTKEICKKLNKNYDFSYSKKLIDISNYNIKKYDNYFLGSYGKKVGTYFTKYGLDDFELITPKFDTDLVVNNPVKKQKQSGKFEDTIINSNSLSYDDVYDSWVYSTYSYGDNALQIIDNKKSDKIAKTILVVRDSFAGVVTPYLSLECKQLHILDLRESVIGTDRIKSVSDYANKIKPDYIIILYKTVKTEECYDFN